MFGDAIVCMLLEVTIKTNDKTANVKSIYHDNVFSRNWLFNLDISFRKSDF